MITPTVNADGIREAVKELKALDATLLKELRKDLKNKISPIAKQIADDVPNDPPLSGFARLSSFGWGPVKPTTSFTPGKSKKTGNHLVSIRINPPKGTRGLYVAEIAGSRSNGKNNRGKAMIRNLNDKYPMKKRGGRFAYTKFRLLRPDALKLATEIVNNTLAKVNKRLDF